MAERNFWKMLEARQRRDNFIGVGLDSSYYFIPMVCRKSTIRETIYCFNREIFEVTKDLASVYKSSLPFYREKDYGVEGIEALIKTNRYIYEEAPDVPIILDCKLGGTLRENKIDAEAAFELYLADAVTIHAYPDQKALEPFLERPDKGIFILCRTSDSEDGDLQNLETEGEPLYKRIARKVADEWNKNNNCGLVVAAVYPDELREVRSVAGDLTILSPAIGAQGGSLEKLAEFGLNSRGLGIIPCSSRSIIQASLDSDFASAARDKTVELWKSFNDYRRHYLNASGERRC